MDRQTIGLSKNYLNRLNSGAATSDEKNIWLRSDLAKSVLKLSDWYIENPQAPTPWDQSWAVEAYQYYFGPLNYIRNVKVAREASSQDFFTGLTHFIDYGAGLGAASLAFSECHKFDKLTHVELSEEASRIFRQHYLPDLNIADFQVPKKFNSITDSKSSLLCFSYSLTELSELPEWAYQAEAIAIIEPGTEVDGRKLLDLRTKLIEKGYHIYAPCTHQGACPLLIHSKHDWCHDRVHFQQPAGWEKLEDKLPIKNRTLAMSYLLARKTKPSKVTANQARIVGDLLKEKGKDRQLVCMNSDRLFLSWLHRNGLQQDIARGSLIKSPVAKLVANELRIEQAVELIDDTK